MSFKKLGMYASFLGPAFLTVMWVQAPGFSGPRWLSLKSLPLVLFLR